MKFSGAVDINKPIDFVVRLFADPNNIGEYQDGFVRKEMLSGQAGENGSVARLFYSDGKRDMILEETVLDNSLPASFKTVYHHEHMDNTMICRFTALNAETTRYETEVEYTRINWAMPRLMAILFPSMYRKPGEKWMQNFKAFAELQS